MPLTPDLTTFTTAAQSVATYSFNDIADGSGTIIFYPFFARDTAEIYRMDTQVFKSEVLGTAANFNVKTTIIDKTFQSKAFNQTRTIRGTAYLKLPVTAAPKYSDNIMDIDATVTLYNYDGSTATSIVAITALTKTTSVGDNYDRELIIEIIVPETTIPVGNYVQLKVLVEMTRTAGTNGPCTGAVGHDPEGETYTKSGLSVTPISVTDTKMILNLPFKIDL